MIQIKHIDYSRIDGEQFSFAEDTENSIFVEDGSFWVKAESLNPDDHSYSATITFNLNKEFIEELKALVTFMERTYKETDYD